MAASNIQRRAGCNIYSDDEITELRQAFSRLRFWPEAEARIIAAAVESGRCSERLAPFWGLAEANPELFDKLGQDLMLETYSFYGLFPGVYERVYLSDRPPQITFDGRTRGRVAILATEAGGLVVKPAQSRREGEIAGIAGGLGVGPVQYPSLPGFITEELVPGTFFTQLPVGELEAEMMYQLGRELGGMLSRLHQARIYYNDATLADPEGRSHLLVAATPDILGTGGGSCRLIDFGVSLLLDRHPQLTLEEVYNFSRTLPEFRLLSGMVASPEAMTSFLENYRQRLARTSIEEIMARDLRFFEEGLRMAARRLGDAGEGILEPLGRAMERVDGGPDRLIFQA